MSKFIAAFLIVFMAVIPSVVSAAESKKEILCGKVTIANGDFPSGVTGDLVLRYLDGENFNAVIVFPYQQQALLEVDPNPMIDNPLWDMIEKCAGGPVFFDADGNRL